MSQVSVNNQAINIHRIAISELYPERNGAIQRESPMISIPDNVRRDKTLELIFCTISGLFSYFESSRTVIV